MQMNNRVFVTAIHYQCLAQPQSTLKCKASDNECAAVQCTTHGQTKGSSWCYLLGQVQHSTLLTS